MTDCVVRVLRVADLERAIAEHPRMALNLMRSLSERLRTAEDQIEALAFRPVPSRLAGKLLELMDRYGRVTPNGIRIDERFTHMQLAEMIGTSRETLTKVLNELRDAGLIDVRERLVWVLDVDGLERLKTAAEPRQPAATALHFRPELRTRGGLQWLKPEPCASRAAWPRCSRAASSWTSPTPSRRGSPRRPARAP